MIEELTTFALMAATVNDLLTSAPVTSQLLVTVVGLGTPPNPVDPGLLWARTVPSGFVVVADASAVPLDSVASSTPSPQHVNATIDLHLHLAADGYTAQDVSIAVVGGTQIPLTAAYLMAPLPVALRGRVMLKGVPPTPLAGATMTVVATAPPVPLPPPVVADANGFYVFPSLPVVHSLVLNAQSGTHTLTQNIVLAYDAPVATSDFLLT